MTDQRTSYVYCDRLPTLASMCTRCRAAPGYQEQHIPVAAALSLDQESRSDQSGVAGETGTGSSPSHAHGGRVARVCGGPTRQMRLYLHAHDQHIPGNKDPTATPTSAVVFALFTPVTLVHFAVDDRLCHLSMMVTCTNLIVADHSHSA
jgi:hypothetical protein